MTFLYLTKTYEKWIFSKSSQIWIIYHSIEEICALPSKDGSFWRVCYGMFNVWFHNSKTEKCEEFIYGGCGGNDNRFDTKEDCENFCIKKTTPHP